MFSSFRSSCINKTNRSSICHENGSDTDRNPGGLQQDISPTDRLFSLFTEETFDFVQKAFSFPDNV